MAKTIHKYDRKTTDDTQWIRCSGKAAVFSEHVTWFWKKVTCKKCLKMK